MIFEPFGLIVVVSVIITGIFTYSHYRKKQKNDTSSSDTRNEEVRLSSIDSEQSPLPKQDSEIKIDPPIISYAFVDVETTGLDCQNDRITEICVFIVTPGVNSQYGQKTLINPGRPLSAFITELTGITDEMLEDQPGEEILHEYFEFIGDRPVYAYHAKFDMGFLQAAAQRLGRTFNNPSICILERLKEEHPNLRSYKLGDACDAFGIVVDGDAHRAEGDVRRALSLWNAVNAGKKPLPLAVKTNHASNAYSVYGHYSVEGALFYVWTARQGESTTPESDSTWSLYVEKKLLGLYEVRCLHSDVSFDQAMDLKNELLAKHANEVLNRANPHRGINTKIYDQSRSSRALCEENKRLGKENEISNPSVALGHYEMALQEVDKYAVLQFENGLFGQFIQEHSRTHFGSDAIKIVDRISLLLCKMKKAEEAHSIFENVLVKYPEVADSSAARIIRKRIEKASK